MIHDYVRDPLQPHARQKEHLKSPFTGFITNTLSLVGSVSKHSYKVGAHVHDRTFYSAWMVAEFWMKVHDD